jgi:hypothetical protein
VNSDPFASNTLSMVLAWIFATPVILTVIAGGVEMLFSRVDEAVPRWFVVWMTLCILVLSPFRYIVLQLIVGSSYAVQSVGAFFSLLALGAYVPIVFGLLYFIGVGLPLVLTLRVAFGSLKNPKATKGRLVVGSVIAPLNAVGGYLAFFWLLQYAAFTVHWLQADDVIGATNGPAAVVYSLVLKHFTPLPVKGYYTEVSNTDREMLRNHVASFYLGWRAEAGYVRLSYLDLYTRLTAQSRSDR